MSDEEDPVIAEYPVFLNQTDLKILINQFHLRASENPYYNIFSTHGDQLTTNPNIKPPSTTTSSSSSSSSSTRTAKKEQVDPSDFQDDMDTEQTSQSEVPDNVPDKDHSLDTDIKLPASTQQERDFYADESHNPHLLMHSMKVKPIQRSMAITLAMDYPQSNMQSKQEMRQNNVAGPVDDYEYKEDIPSNQDLGQLNNPYAALHLKSEIVPQKVTYALAMIVDDQVHLSPVDGVFHITPDLEFVDEEDLNSKAMDIDASNASSSSSKPSSDLKRVSTNFKKGSTEQPSTREQQEKSQLMLQNAMSNEKWQDTVVYGVNDSMTKSVRKQLIEPSLTSASVINFDMDRATYLSSLSDPAHNKPDGEDDTTDSMEVDHTEILENDSQPFPKAKLWKMPLTQQIIILLRRGNILSFKKLKEWTVPGTTDNELLRALAQEAQLVQGYWVLESRHLKTTEEQYRLARDYLLSFFATDTQIKRKHFIEVTGLTPKEATRILSNYAFLHSSKGWKFKETQPDAEFADQHQDLVDSSRSYWEEMKTSSQSGLQELKLRLKEIRRNNNGSKKGKGKLNQLNTLTVSNTINTMKIESVTHDDTRSKPDYDDSMKQDVQSKLGDLIQLNATNNGVISLSTIQNTLQSDVSLPARVPSPIIREILDEMCEKIGEVYVLKSSFTDLDGEDCDFRDAVIKMFKTSNKWKKQDIHAFVKKETGRELPSARYSKIMNEMANSTGGMWLLKSG